MKYYIVLIIGIIGLLLFAGCDSDTPIEKPSLPVANIQMNFADGTEQYENYSEFVHTEEASWLIFTTDTPVTDLRFIEIYAIKSSKLAVADTLFSTPEFTPDKPFLVRTFTYWADVGEMFGISFRDANGERRFFHINGTMGDPLGLLEFTSAGYISFN